MHIKVATLLGVATFFFASMFEHIWSGEVTNLANIWSGGAVTRRGFRRDLVWLPQISRR